MDDKYCEKCQRVVKRVGGRWVDFRGESVCTAGGLHKV